MKQLILSFLCVLFLGSNAFADNIPAATKVADLNSAVDVKAIDPQLVQMGLEKFLEMTPAKYKEVTGKRLGLKKSLALKAAQAKVKHEMKNNDMNAPGDGITKGLYVLLAILGLGWLAMGLLSDWEGSDWIINLVLVVVTCWIGALVHALVKMKDYYSN